MNNSTISIITAVYDSDVSADSADRSVRFRDGSGHLIITDYEPPTADPGTEFVLIGIRRPYGRFDTLVAFAPDKTTDPADAAYAEAYRILKESEVSDAVTATVFATYRERVREALSDPFRMYIEVDGISLRDCGKIADCLKIRSGGISEQAALTVRILRRAAHDGDCYLHKDTVCKKLNGRTRKPAEFAEVLTFLTDEGYVVRDGYRIYLTELYEAERYAAEDLTERMASGYGCFDVKTRAAESGQERAIRLACGHTVSIITGGPGTGKTTVSKEIIRQHTLKDPKMTIGLYAPTGKAAQRLSEQTGHEGMTMHLAISRCIESGEMINGLVIIDEASMVDIRLLSAFLRCISTQAKIAFVGDGEQLPSIGPGSVLCDLIESGAIPVAELKTVFRQTEAPGIIRTSHLIRAGYYDIFDDDTLTFKDNVSSEEECATSAVLEYQKLRDAGTDPKDIVVLTPYASSGASSAKSLNRLICEELHPDGDSVDIGEERTIRLQDRVIHTRNDYHVASSHGEGVFNGETGSVIAIGSEGSKDGITVEFDDGKVVLYTPVNFEELDLAYALTIHKSQGSEYDYVIVVLPDRGDRFMTRRLLYTAVTRARKKCIVISQGRAYQKAVRNVSGVTRNSWLSKSMKELSRP